MRKIQVMVLTLFAVLAFGAVLASSAFGAELTLPAEWLANGNKVGAALATQTTGAILLEDNKTSLGAESWLCNVLLNGTVGPAGKDEITRVLNPAGEEVGLVARLALEEPNCVTENLCNTPLVYPVGLPWTTELFLMEDGEILDLINNSGYEFECTIGLKVTDECKAVDAALPVLNDPVTGDAETPGGVAAEPLATCSLGGSAAGVNETDELATISLGNGELLTVSSE